MNIENQICKTEGGGSSFFKTPRKERYSEDLEDLERKRRGAAFIQGLGGFIEDIDPFKHPGTS